MNTSSMFRTLLVAAFAFPALSTFAAEKEKSGGQLDPKDAKFVHEAAVGGMAEVKLGEMAREKASRAEVKEFGARMVTDHSKANDDLKQLASAKGVSLPDQLDKKHSATAERLGKLSGEEFDKAYVAEMLEDHRKDVKEFKEQSSSAKDPEVKGFASRTLPVLQEHLTHVEKLSGKAAK